MLALWNSEACIPQGEHRATASQEGGDPQGCAQFKMDGRQMLMHRFFADAHKSLTFQYNFLNLPRQITKGGTGALTNTYDATGRKWQAASPEGIRTYLSGIEYLDGQVQTIPLPDGRFAKTPGGTWRTEYHHKDHLGNLRIAFSDLDGNGRITHNTVGQPQEVTQEEHYYPFGMAQAGMWYGAVTPGGRYKYNGKELVQELDLGWHDYGARGYDAALGRFGGVDPLAGPQASYSPYHYVYNNPLSFIDPTGMVGQRTNEPASADGLTNEEWLEASKPSCCPGMGIAGAQIRSQSAQAIAKTTGDSYENAYLDLSEGEAEAGIDAIKEGFLFYVGGKLFQLVFKAGRWFYIEVTITNTKLIAQFSTRTIDEAVALVMKNSNDVKHIFNPKHNLGGVVSKLGGQENTVRAVLNAANGKLPASGVFNNIPVSVGGQTIFLRGNVINGVPRLGTMFIK